jgi:CubicO group peptidase (beta-lactamase class C family)
MKCSVLVMLLVACGAAPPTGSPRPAPSPGWTQADETARQLEPVARDAKFQGVILVGRGDRLALYRPFGAASRADPAVAFRPDDRWRWASVTKQVVAVLVLQEVERKTIDLAAPVARYLPAFASANAGTATIEHLLRHQAGLPNPDDGTPRPAFYDPGRAVDPLAFCAGPVTGPPGDKWAYNNCDYVVLGEVLRAVTGRPWTALVEERIARPLGIATVASATAATVTGWDGAAREPVYAYDRFGAGAALVGTLPELWAFDRALLGGRLLSPAARHQLWDGRPALGYMALGQWVYAVPLAGCAKPVQIVERRGAIGGIQLRNFILPALDTVIIAATNRGEVDFGEPWSGAGLSYALLSRVACAAGAAGS